MKKTICILLGIALSLSLLAGCGGGEPAPVNEGGAEGIIAYLTGSGNEDYLLTDNAEADLTGVAISADRTVLLQEGITLTLNGTFAPGEGRITVRAGSEGGNKPALDLSALNFTFAAEQETALFEVRSDTTLRPPQAQERLTVDTSNDEWTSIKVMRLQDAAPQDEEPQDAGPGGTYEISTPEEFLEFLPKANTEQIELNNDLTVALDGVALTHDVFIVCNGHALTLMGTINMEGGVLDIGENPDVESGTVDISGLTVMCAPDAYPSGNSDILFIGMNFKQIIGEPALGDGLLYEIPDDGSHASVKIKEVTTPEMHEAKLQEDMTQYLSGVDFPGGVGIRAEFLTDGVLEVELDNPTITEVIGVSLDAGVTLILTGSVTFDGGNYGFELHDDSTGTATVDITGLQINGTEALGDTRSPDIFMARDHVEIKFNESDPHIEVVENDRFWLRYVQ